MSGLESEFRKGSGSSGGGLGSLGLVPGLGMGFAGLVGPLAAEADAGFGTEIAGVGVGAGVGVDRAGKGVGAGAGAGVGAGVGDGMSRGTGTGTGTGLGSRENNVGPGGIERVVGSGAVGAEHGVEEEDEEEL